MHGIFKLVAVSDLHFGNPRISSEQLYLKLKKILYPELRDTHLVVIAGDLYDQLLTVSSKAHRYAAMFIADLFRFSARTGCQIRILHGTYTHDRDQLSVFSTLALPQTRYKIINEISCEEITDFRYLSEQLNLKLRVGYLPDNLSYKHSEDAVAHLQRSMTCCGWNTLDLLVGHGAFAHTLPVDANHRPPCLYTHEQFKNLVQGPIVMGHIHVHSRKYNIYYCGSFDRMAHGEEEPKGFYVFTRDDANREGWRTRFVVDTLATPFISIQPEGTDLSAISSNFLEQMDEKFPTRSGFVRVIHKSPEVRSLLHRVSVQHFPEVVYSSKSTGEQDTDKIRVDEISLDICDEVRPDIHNLGGLVCQYLEENNLLDSLTREQILDRMQRLLDNLI